MLLLKRSVAFLIVIAPLFSGAQQPPTSKIPKPRPGTPEVPQTQAQSVQPAQSVTPPQSAPQNSMPPTQDQEDQGAQDVQSITPAPASAPEPEETAPVTTLPTVPTTTSVTPPSEQDPNASLKSPAIFPFTNLTEIANETRINAYFSLKPARRIKIAVFDHGFEGLANEVGQTLPADTHYHPGPKQHSGMDSNSHGVNMAQIVYALMTQEGRNMTFNPEIYLYKVDGYANFVTAIDDVIDKKIDVVLYAEVRDFGGNFDGQGFWNSEVDRATHVGVLWVNAAGNYGHNTFNTDIRTSNDGTVHLYENNHGLGVRCSPEFAQSLGIRINQCHLHVVLTWSDFKNDPDSGTEKDLDLTLTDDHFNPIQASALHQNTKRSTEGYTIYPREEIELDVPPGQYYLFVTNQTPLKFTRSDRLRISAEGVGVLLNQYDMKESLLSPADNPSAITVGALYFPFNSSSDRMRKPELLASSNLKLTQGGYALGSSGAAAIVTAGVGILKSLYPDWDRNTILSYVAHPTIYSGGRASQFDQQHLPRKFTTSSPLDFSGTGEKGCFKSVSLNQIHIQNYLVSAAQQGIVVETTKGYKIMVDFDPFTLTGHTNHSSYEAVVGTPSGYQAISRNQMAQHPISDVEIFQRPPEGLVCGENPQPTLTSLQESSLFKLPRL